MKKLINNGAKHISTAIVLSLVLLSGPAFAYYGEFQIGDEPVNPRISAMGSAGTALAGKGSCYYNPASPAFAPAPYLSAEFGQIPGDMSKSLIETAWMFPRWFAGASMRVHSTDFGVTTEQTVDPANVPLSSDQILQATLNGGFTFGNGRFAAGHSVNFYQERIGDKVYHSWTYSPGIVYRLVPGKITIGASMLNYVRLDTVRSPWYKTPRAWYEGAWGLPRYTRAGVAWSDTLKSASMPFTLTSDLVYSDVYGRLHAGNLTNNIYDHLLVPLGAEVWLTPYLAVRTGLNINHPAEKFHFGTGIRWSNIAFDFDYGLTRPVYGAELESKWLFGLTYSLKSTIMKNMTVVTGSPKRTPPVEEPKTFAPPKRILLTPKQFDSSKVTVPPKDTGTLPVPDSSKSVPYPDSSGMPVETVPVNGSAPGVEVPSSPMPADSASKRDTVGK